MEKYNEFMDLWYNADYKKDLDLMNNIFDKYIINSNINTRNGFTSTSTSYVILIFVCYNCRHSLPH